MDNQKLRVVALEIVELYYSSTGTAIDWWENEDLEMHLAQGQQVYAESSWQEKRHGKLT
ncbi:hypothetical protein [Nostoc sp. ChiQUE01b]|uniref:hypothetical protein n=1 Tax=Nostoc sp. ChiQUE01b TaxID=3075376 RepID=UPI002AD238E5|nr:hypothetical protein [Nostoc sp. ChiQUE01b]MDZ8264031.1 hypothetical protein [Nostoc sp. ChiQUE01b]